MPRRPSTVRGGSGAPRRHPKGPECRQRRSGRQARALVAFAARVAQAAGYTEVFTPGEYSYVFDGGSGSLDHVFASPSMRTTITGHTIWDINATECFAYAYDGYQPLYGPYQYRASDHNPTLVGVDTKAGTPAAGHGRR